MAKRFAKKDEYQKEQEEVERLVRKSPKQKPPRSDKTRERVKTVDPDIDRDSDTKGDPDMSMNYKDIGGSVVDRVALRVLYAFDFEADGEAAETAEEVPEEGAESEPESEPEDDTKEEFEVDEPVKPRKRLDSEIESAAIEFYSKNPSEIIGLLEKGDLNDSEKETLNLALQLKTKPLPPNWDVMKVFKEGVVVLKERQRFRKHMQNWDARQFADYDVYFKEKYLNESLTESREWFEHYYKVMESLVAKEWEDFQSKGVPPLKAVEDFIEDLDNPDAEFGSKSQKALKEAKASWWEKIRRTSASSCKTLLREVEDHLGDVEKPLSNLAAWLGAASYYLKGALIMKGDESMKLAAIRQAMTKEAQYRGVKDLHTPSLEHKPWRLAEPRLLGPKDYAAIVKDAVPRLQDPYIANDLLEYDVDMACRVALDLSIASYERGKYDKTVDAPTYEGLVKIMTKLLS